MLQAISQLRDKADSFEKTYGEVLEVTPEYSEKAAAIAHELGITLPGIPFSEDMKEKPKKDWTASEAADYTKHCVF